MGMVYLSLFILKKKSADIRRKKLFTCIHVVSHHVSYLVILNSIGPKRTLKYPRIQNIDVKIQKL